MQKLLLSLSLSETNRQIKMRNEKADLFAVNSWGLVLFVYLILFCLRAVLL